MTQQLFFEMDFEKPGADDSSSPEGGGSSLRKRRLAIQRAVLRWLEANDSPTGMGVNVVTRIQRLRADIAAFWSVPVRNSGREGPERILAPARTTIVQCYAQRDECWLDCVQSDQILPELKELKRELETLEASIRSDEPELRDRDALFEEYAEWRYDQSTNRRYHQLKRAVERMEHGLYHGTKFERIRSAQLADNLYLAVPAGMVEAAELADGWGLLWVDDDLSVRIMSTPEERECLPDNRVHLVQNIAAACKNSLLTVHGIAQKGGDTVFTRPVRRRRAVEKTTLSDA